MQEKASVGWYADPTQPTRMRYWDGESWGAYWDGGDEHSPPKRGMRKMTFVLIGWTVAMGIWIIWAIHVGASCAGKYAGSAYAGASTTGCQAGSGIAVGLVVLLWFIGFVVLSLIWFMTRPQE